MSPDASDLVTVPPKEGLGGSFVKIADVVFRFLYDLDRVFEGLGTDMGLQLSKSGKGKNDADVPLIMSLILRAVLFGLPGIFMTYLLPPLGAILFTCFFTAYIYKRTKFLAEDKAAEGAKKK